MNISTNRLLLCPWQLEDLNDLVNLNSDPAVYKWLGGPNLINGSKEALDFYVGTYKKNGWGVLKVQTLEGHFLGLAGLQSLKPYLNIAPGIEAVWRFHSGGWGKGYAQEAMSAILNMAPSHIVNDEIFAVIAAANLRSIKTAESLGFKYDCNLDFLHPYLDKDNVLRPHKVLRLATEL